MMFALRANDAAFGNDVCFTNDAAPYGAVGKQHIIAPIGSSIMIREANHIIFARAKTSFIYHPRRKLQYNILQLSARRYTKKGRDVPVLFILL